MEKYRQFADETKGVNPFVPVWSNYKEGMAAWLLRLLFFGLLLLPIKAAVFLIGLVLVVFGEAVLSVLAVAPALHNLCARLLLAPGCRLCLLGLGFFRVSSGSEAEARRLRLRTDGTSAPATRPQLLFANFQSAVDILYLGLYGYNSFSFGSSNSVGKFSRPCNLLSALSRASAIRTPLGDSDGDPLEASLPTVVFAEAAKTNGTCVLPFRLPSDWQRKKSLEPQRFACVTISYSKHGPYTPPQTVSESLFVHVLRLQLCLSHSVTAKWLPERLVGINVKKEEMATQLRSWVCTMAQPSLHDVSSKAEDAGRFFDYWLDTQKKTYGRKGK